jgi:LuxR family maltose regulon positive regulatory protein
VTYGQRALELLPAEDKVWRGAASSILGIGYWTSGDLEAAYRTFAEGKDLLASAGFTQFRNSGVHILADIRVAQGRLRDAERLYTEALRLVAELGDPIWGTGDLHVGLAELLYERNDLAAATQRLQQSRELGEHATMPDTRHRWYVAMARIRQAEGDLDGALEMLDEAVRQYVIGPDPVVRPMTALKAQIRVAQGRIADALGWVGKRNLSVNDELTYLREFEHLTLARVLIARYTRAQDDSAIDAAVGLLERLLKAAEAGERPGSVIEVLVVLSLARQARGDAAGAGASLERALGLAEPEGYVRTFIDEGAPMARLLADSAVQGVIAPQYIGRLLAAFGLDAPVRESATAPLTETQAQPLIEPLSQRELEVLRLIAQGLSNHEIGERLYLALSTVKGHNRVIFGKLDVQRRTEAVARARELGLV